MEFSHHFGPVETRWQACKYLRGLMAPLERRNGWTLAEQAGDATPDSMQALLCSPCFDRDAVRDAVRARIVAEIGDPGGVLVADETGFIKKGACSAGVQRQYTGTSGKIDNCQLGVFLADHTSAGRALIDLELYLPRSWTDDRDRCRKAHIGDEITFATKPQQAKMMLERAVEAGLPFGWFTADEAYGQNLGLRDWCEQQDIAYVMATRKDHEVASGLHTTTRVDELIGKIRAGAWRRMSCGDGAHGPRVYYWVSAPVRATFSHGRRGWVLARRNITTGELGPRRHRRRRARRFHPRMADRVHHPAWLPAMALRHQRSRGHRRTTTLDRHVRRAAAGHRLARLGRRIGALAVQPGRGIQRPAGGSTPSTGCSNGSPSVCFLPTSCCRSFPLGLAVPWQAHLWVSVAGSKH